MPPPSRAGPRPLLQLTAGIEAQLENVGPRQVVASDIVHTSVPSPPHLALNAAPGTASCVVPTDYEECSRVRA